jgi:hypothetical protein
MRLMTNATTKKIRNTTKSTRAIESDVDATDPKPIKPAINAKMRKPRAQRSMSTSY